jgi:hypothetical protein
MLVVFSCDLKLFVEIVLHASFERKGCIKVEAPSQ